MSQRGVLFADVQHLLMTTMTCKPQEGGTYRVDGADRAGDELTAVVALEDGILVVTVF
jgi:hypothetical protein